jgi:hypothetical protein
MSIASVPVVRSMMASCQSEDMGTSGPGRLSRSSIICQEATGCKHHRWRAGLFACYDHPLLAAALAHRRQGRVDVGDDLGQAAGIPAPPCTFDDPAPGGGPLCLTWLTDVLEWNQ